MSRLIQISCVVLFATLVISEETTKEIPSYIQVCQRDDPKLGACIRKSILNLRPYLGSGIPELEIPSLDPLVIPEVKVAQNAGAITLESTYQNITITGPTKFRLRTVRVDPKSDKFRMKIWFPDLQMNAKYDIKGKLLMMPLLGKGVCYGNFSDIDAILSMKMERYMKNSNEHFKVKNLEIEFNIGGLNVKLDNLFNGDAELGSTMNKFINENWKMVTAEIRPTLEKTISNILMDTANKIFDVYPISKLLPEGGNAVKEQVSNA